MSSKTILITGANRGLGLELTRQYLADGEQVIAFTRTIGRELAALDGDGGLEIHQLSLTDDDALARVAGCCADRSIDVLINNAGSMGYLSFGDGGLDVQKFGTFDRQEWLELFDINVCTPMALAELLAEALARDGGGVVANLSSGLGSIGTNTKGGLYGYRASKAALNAVTRSLALDLAARNIVAVALTPGWVRTDMGGPDANLDVATSVAGLRSVIADLTPEHAGRLLSWDGSELPW